MSWILPGGLKATAATVNSSWHFDGRLGMSFPSGETLRRVALAFVGRGVTFDIGDACGSMCRGLTKRFGFGDNLGAPAQAAKSLNRHKSHKSQLPCAKNG